MKKNTWRAVTLLLTLTCASLVLARGAEEEVFDLSKKSVEGLKPLFKRGELVLLSSKPDGSPREATAMAAIAAPVDVVWSTILDYDSYSRFVPRVVGARVVRREGKSFDVRYEVEVPGKNYRYTIRFEANKAQHKLSGRWLSGDLRGGRWSWNIYSSGEGTVVTYTAHTDVGKASRLVRALDDKYHTLSFGLDVSSSVLMVKAIRREAERRAPAPKKDNKNF